MPHLFKQVTILLPEYALVHVPLLGGRQGLQLGRATAQARHRQVEVQDMPPLLVGGKITRPSVGHAMDEATVSSRGPRVRVRVRVRAMSPRMVHNITTPSAQCHNVTTHGAQYHHT